MKNTSKLFNTTRTSHSNSATVSMMKWNTSSMKRASIRNAFGNLIHPRDAI